MNSFLRLMCKGVALTVSAAVVSLVAIPTCAGQVQAHRIQQGPCIAVVPAGWSLVPGPNGQTADMGGPNGARAAWGILGVNTAMQRYYGNIDGPPDPHTLALLAQILSGPATFTSTKTIGNFFTMHAFQSAAYQGVVLYHAYPAAAGQYIISEYFAWAGKGNAAALAQATAVMTSLQCVSSVRPSQPAIYQPKSSVPNQPSSSSGSAEADNLKDYNTQLGTQYAHDSTGQNYLLDYATQWQSTGPDGPGYYKGSGVNMEKLTPGYE